MAILNIYPPLKKVAGRELLIFSETLIPDPDIDAGISAIGADPEPAPASAAFATFEKGTAL